MISSWPILSIITFLPLCGALFAFFIPSKNDESTNINYNQNIKLLALWTSIMTLIISLLICINFDYGAKDYQFEEISSWIPSLGIIYHLVIDGISFLGALCFIHGAGPLLLAAFFGANFGRDPSRFFSQFSCFLLVFFHMKKNE